MSIDTSTVSGRGVRVLATAITVVVAAFATLASAVLSISACIGSEGAGVNVNSVRSQVCDVPAVGPWPYPIIVGLLATAWTVRALWRGTIARGAVWIAFLIPVAAVALVPLVLSLLPRQS